MADTEEDLENRHPTSKKPKLRSINKIVASNDGLRKDSDEAFNGLPRSKKDKKKAKYTEEAPEIAASKKPKLRSINKIVASNDGLRKDSDEAFNGLPRSKKDKKKAKYTEEAPEIAASKKPKLRSINKIVASNDGLRKDSDEAFNGGRHLVFKRYGVPPDRLDDLKSFPPKLEKYKEELIRLLSSEKEDEKLRNILTNLKDGKIGLDDCITFIWTSLGIIQVPNLLPEKEAEEFLLKHPVLADTSAESESRGEIESNPMALIKNLEEQVACITDLISFLEVAGSTKVEMDRVIKRLFVLLKNEN